MPANTDTPPFRPQQIAPFVAGDDERTAMSASAMNEIVGVLNRLLKLQIVRGGDDDDGEDVVVWSDSNVVIQLAKAVADGGGGVNFQDQYNSANSYNLGDLVWTSRNGFDRILWIAIQAVPAGTAPTWPEPTTVYWRCIARFPIYMGAYNPTTAYVAGDVVYTGGTTSRTPWFCEVGGTGNTPVWPEPTSGTVYWRCLAQGGGKPMLLYFKYAEGDYIVCSDGASTPTLYNVAKPYKLRNSIGSATVYGDAITYSGYSTDPVGGLPADASQTRTATDSSLNTETQVIVPEYLLGDPIWAQAVDHTGIFVTVDGVSTEVTLIDLNIDARAWAKAST